MHCRADRTSHRSRVKSPALLPLPGTQKL